MSSLSKSAVYTILTQVPTQLFGIISGVFITRMLGPEGRGLYAIFYADIALFSMFLGFSINTAITHFSATNRLEEGKILGVSALFSTATVSLSILLLFIWLNLPISDLLFPKEYTSIEYMLWFVVYLTISQINSIYSAFFQGAKRFDVVNKVLFFNSVFNLTLFGIAFLLHAFDLLQIGLFEVLLLGLVVVGLNLFQWYRHYKKSFIFRINLKLKWSTDIKPFFKFMGLGHLSNVINFLNYRFVLWVMAYYLNEGQIGVFSLGAGLSHLLYFLTNPLSQVLTPFMSAAESEDRLLSFIRFARYHFTLIFLMAIFTVLFFAPLVPYVYGFDFANSTVVLQLIIFGIILSCQTKMIASYFISTDKVLLNLLATMFGFLLTFLFNIILVKHYGIYGAAIAQTITYTGIFVFVYAAFLKLTKWKAVNIFIINREDLRYARKQFKRSTK